MAASGNTLFRTAVEGVLNSWTVLKLAVSHGFGGADGEAKAAWMVHAVDQWFSENVGLEVDEVEDFLADILNHEFDTVADDGSLTEIARLICGFYKLCQAGDEQKVREKLQQLPNAAVQNSVQSQETPDMEEVQGNDVQGMDPDPPPVLRPPQQSQSESASNTDSMETDEDGWHVVKKGKKK